jgi:two-component system response regulator NreC
MSANLHLASASSGARTSDRVDSTIRVVLADDHAIVRRNLRLLLDDEDDVDVVSEAETIGSVVRDVHGHAPHVLVLDLQMPGGSSVEAIRRLRQQVPATEIVVLTMERSPAFAQRAIDAGAIGFVLKDRSDIELPEAVRRAARGDEFVSPHVAAGLEALRRTVTGDGLSRRETEVLRAIALGYTSAEIATRMHLSRRTIETHRANIHRKLGLATRAELVHFALRRNLISV